MDSLSESSNICGAAMGSEGIDQLSENDLKKNSIGYYSGLLLAMN